MTVKALHNQVDRINGLLRGEGHGEFYLDIRHCVWSLVEAINNKDGRHVWFCSRTKPDMNRILEAFIRGIEIGKVHQDGQTITPYRRTIRRVDGENVETREYANREKPQL